MPEVVPTIETFARIKVVGVGGGGGKALDRMLEGGIGDVEFVAINTDAQALHKSTAPSKVHIGKQTTRGLGAGADPAVGRAAAEESRDEIKKSLEGADMIFIVSTMGGGTGSGAAAIVAEEAQSMEILTVGFATRPFSFEGEKRRRNAETGIANFREHIDTLITIPNDRILQTVDRRTPLLEAFAVVDDVLRQGVQGISDLITVDGLINLDFADVKAIMDHAGSALMGIGKARGDDRAIRAAKEAIESPLLEVSIDGARGVLFSVSGGNDMAMHEINEAAEAITAAVDPEANIIFGANIDETLEGEMRITVIATGFDAAYNVDRHEIAGEGLAYFNKPMEEVEAEMATAPTPTTTVMPDVRVPDEPINLDDKSSGKGDTSDLWSFNADDKEWDVPAFVRNRDKADDKPADRVKTDDKPPSDTTTPSATDSDKPAEDKPKRRFFGKK